MENLVRGIRHISLVAFIYFYAANAVFMSTTSLVYAVKNINFAGSVPSSLSVQ
jgi:hypothetical protein